jgi:hypothetical protein
MPPKKHDNKKKKDSDEEDSKKKNSVRASSTAAPPKSSSSIIDWYLLNIVAHIAFFFLIGVIDIYGDWHADATYQILGLIMNSIKIANPDSHIIYEILNFRIATRVLRPYSLVQMVLLRFNDYGPLSPKTLLAAAMTMHDVALICVGAAILFRFARIDIVKAVYRECWFVMAVLRLVVYFGDPLATVSCICEIFATNCLLYMLATGGKAIPGRYLGILSFIVGSQKFYYMF